MERSTVSSPTGRKWAHDEHARFLEAMALYPRGPWKQRADHIGTRTARQVMTHAQKITLRDERRARGLQKAGRPRRGTTSSQSRARQTPDDTSTAEAIAAILATAPPLETALSASGFVEMLQSPWFDDPPRAEVDGFATMLSVFPTDECVGAPDSPVSPGTGGGFLFGGGDALWVFPEDFGWDPNGDGASYA